MLNIISENIGTIIVSVFIIAVVCAIIIKLLKDRKNGRSSCGCGCEHCAMSAQCHGKNK